MKQGFTLIELLIVMVIVGTLVTVALPKYQVALERGRALEGIRNVQYVAEYVNAKHMATGEWPEDINDLQRTDTIKSRFFGAPQYEPGADTITIIRDADSGWGYSLTATISDDVLSEIRCANTGEEDVCTKLDLTGNLMTRK